MGAKKEKFKESKPESVEVRFYSCEGQATIVELSDPDKIGQGAFGKTFATLLKLKDDDGDEAAKNQGRFAIKVCEDDNPIERDILLKMKHPNVIRLFFHNVINKQMYMVLELMDARDLYEVVLEAAKAGESLGMYIQVYAYQLFRGLACKY